MSKALLMILDGWGIGNKSKADVISVTPTPHWDALLAKYPHSQLQASGENVGLPDGQMGNSEVGHLNIGAGRVVYQDLVKINRSIRDNSIMQNPEIVAAYKAAQAAGKKLHIMGLCSNGGVHSSLDHLFKLVEIAKEYGVADKTVRDSLPTCKDCATRPAHISLLSSVVSTQWTVTNAGSVSKWHMTSW